MANTDLAIRIATILDSTGLKKADKAVGGLQKSVKSLGKSLGVALSVGTVVAFGKASVKAFADAEKANVRLARNVQNLGLGFATKQIQANLDKISASSGIAGETLVSAFEPLISVTGSVTKSLDLLNIALDGSVSTGIDLATVAQDIANAFVGNVKGLKKYNLGLTQAELSVMSFADIQKKLNNQFRGSNAAYLETYAGKMQILGEAATTAQETIGKGLVDALMAISGNTDIQGLISDIDAFAQDLAATLVEVGKLIKPIVDSLKGLIGLLKQGGTVDVNISPAEQFRREMNNRKPLYGPETVVNAYQNAASQRKAAQDSAKAEAAAAKRARELANLTKKNTAELKKQAALKKAQGIFDLDKIQAVAALQGQITEDEKLRLHLQLALLMGNDEQAKALSEKLAASQLKTQGLATALKDLPTEINPFKDWVSDLDKTLQKLREIAAFTQPGGSSERPGLPSMSPTVASLVTGATTGIAGSNSAGDVYITVNGSVLSEQDLVDAVQNGLNYNALAGKRSDIGRIAGMFG